MLSVRTPGAQNLNLKPGTTIQKPEVLSRVPEMVRNVVKLTVIRKTRVVVVKPEVDLQNLHLVKSEVAESEKLVAAIFLLPVWPLEPLGHCFSCLIIPAKAFARDYVITGVGLSVCLSVCYHDN